MTRHRDTSTYSKASHPLAQWLPSSIQSAPHAPKSFCWLQLNSLPGGVVSVHRLGTAAVAVLLASVHLCVGKGYTTCMCAFDDFESRYTGDLCALTLVWL